MHAKIRDLIEAAEIFMEGPENYESKEYLRECIRDVQNSFKLCNEAQSCLNNMKIGVIYSYEDLTKSAALSFNEIGNGFRQLMANGYVKMRHTDQIRWERVK